MRHHRGGWGRHHGHGGDHGSHHGSWGHAFREHAEALFAARGRGGDDEDHWEHMRDRIRGRMGGGGGGRWGRGGGRPLGHGDLRVLALALIGEKPRHGYDLIQAISERFAGGYTPSPGAIYPLLTMLEEEGLISSSVEGAKKLYTLTSDGEAWLKENDTAVQGMLARIDMAASHYSSQHAPEEVWEAWKTLKQAMNMPRGPWTKEEADRVCAILAKAARDIAGKP
jgi:DNA-binding PadR family transcriptional regulator